MSEALSSSIGIVAYLALFGGVGSLFLFASLLVGRFVRPANPQPGKLEIYECGEPTIGSSFVQFDLRFYVVALLFIIFDVEVAFFFPWATVFGKSTHLMDREFVVAEQSPDGVVLTDSARHLYQELGVRGLEKPSPAVTQAPMSLQSAVAEDLDEEAQANQIAHAGARQLALITIVDILVFFAVLLVGFAYVWMRGDLDWVRAVTRDGAGADREPDVPVASQETALSA
jgi:NADH-quinone oxidoreductase subunit A